jgi:hypothetical protein
MLNECDIGGLDLSDNPNPSAQPKMMEISQIIDRTDGINKPHIERLRSYRITFPGKCNKLPGITVDPLVVERR